MIGVVGDDRLGDARDVINGDHADPMSRSDAIRPTDGGNRTTGRRVGIKLVRCALKICAVDGVFLCGNAFLCGLPLTNTGGRRRPFFFLTS